MGGPLAFPATAIRSVPSGRIVGRSTTGTGRAELLTGEQLRELCSLYSVSQIDSALAGKVGTSDSRLSDARTPTTHQHAQSDITGLVAALAGFVDTASALDQAFSETITWTGTTAPSGTATNRYSWVRVGKIVYFCFRFQWSVAGSGLVTAEWSMPAAMPQPAAETGTENNEVMTMQLSGVAASPLQTINHAFAAESRIALDSNANVRFRARFGSTAVMTLIFNGVYRCA